MKQGGNPPSQFGAFSSLTDAQRRQREKAKKKGQKVINIQTRLDKPNRKMNRPRIGE